MKKNFTFETANFRVLESFPARHPIVQGKTSNDRLVITSTDKLDELISILNKIKEKIEEK
jgi:hypothetical protein